MKHQFATLDGLRGLAALSVMAYHRRDWFGGAAFIGHAYLAVDFFFLLSGFVLAHAYGRRIEQRGAAGLFLVDRVVRLHPMLFFGALVALVVAIMDATTGRPVGTHNVPLTFFAHAIPVPAIWEDTAAAFPWNIAIWSLFWELVANVLFAFLAPWLTSRSLAVIVAASVLAMLYASGTHGGFQVGFARDLSQFLWGFPRVCASFFGGVLIYRRYRTGAALHQWVAVACAGVLLLTFTAIPSGAAGSSIYDPVVAYALYPALLIVAARATPPSVRAASILGAVSYPLYVIHEPMLRVVGGALVKARLSDGHPGALEAIGRLLLVVLIAYAVLKRYDEPARRIIGRRFGSKAGRGTPPRAR